MSRRSTSLLKTALSAIHDTGAARLLAPYTGGSGVIFMLHHVRPEPPEEFEPNRILKVTPRFLEDVVIDVRQAGFDIVSMDEVIARLASGAGRPFAAFTLDDGYRDNRDYAYPVFKRYGLPFTVYVASDFADHRGDLWWLALEQAIRAVDEFSIVLDGGIFGYRTATTSEKYDAFHDVYWRLRAMDETAARKAVAELAARSGVDRAALCSELVMTWQELREFASDPLVTIGAHTKGHFALAKLGAERARAEIVASVSRIEVKLDRPCRHFSYPYGCERAAGERDFQLAADAGLASAVTTRKGLLYPHHAKALTALPRLSLNGDYQQLKYVRALLSGAPFALRDAVRGMLGARAAS